MSATEIPRRWPLIVALLGDPVRESRRLIAELARWPAPARRHSILDASGRPKAEATPAPVTDQVPGEPAQPKARKPHARGAARFNAKRWIAERDARRARERDA